MQSALRLIYPPNCMTCGDFVTSDYGLCGPCWRDTPFVTGLACDKCGVPLPGLDCSEEILCDDCLVIARPWSQGRAALVYRNNARRIVLGLKHGDRLDLVEPAAHWMAKAGQPMFRPDMLVVPVPLHWMRFLKRRYNQSALLGAAIARQTGLSFCPDLLIRPRRTRTQDGMGRDARFRNMANAIQVHPGRMHRIAGRPVLLIDDVMTSGATLAAAADACLASRASDVFVLTLARVAKDD